MPASWEIKAAKQVLCAFLHTDLTSIKWALGFRKLLPYHMPILPQCGRPYDDARNECCRVALANGFDNIFFLDSDVVCPPDTVLRLLSHKEDFISGVYFRRSPPHGLPVMIRHDWPGGWYTGYRPGSVVEVDRVGAGCLLLSRRFLENVPPQRPGHHWFDWKVNYRGQKVFPDDDCTSEDFTLCEHAKRNGFTVKADTSILCQHVGLAEAGPGTFVPCVATGG